MGSVQLRPHAKLCVSGILSKCFVYAVPLPWLSICFPLNLFIVLPEFGKFCRILHACGKELEHYRQNLSSSLAKSKSRAAKRRKKLRAVGIRKKECRKTLATARPSIELFPMFFRNSFSGCTNLHSVACSRALVGKIKIYCERFKACLCRHWS